MITLEGRTEEKERIAAELSTIDGFTGQVWGYVVSHAKLTIRFVPLEEGETNAHVVCSGCEWISLPTGWTNARLRVDLERISHEGDPVLRSHEGDRFRLRLTDAAANVVVCCGSLELSRDVQPIF
jgi:hypothetical protein